MIKPSIGRRVWYWPSDSDRTTMTASDPKQPCDSGIAYVHGDRLVNLSVADHNGVMHRRTSVQLLQDDDAPPSSGGGYAQWMPYQVGQSKAAS